MRVLISMLLLTVVIPAYGLGPAHHPFLKKQPDTIKVLPLKDSSRLHMDRRGYMTMSDSLGRVMEMEDGVTMELMDGRFLVMKNEPAGARLHRIVRAHPVR
ncbi:MAG: CopK family periplasmic copper-binding protein [Pseudomonadales bacterium]|nr:CopK family periplasmic copper-binding protein [Pseudomonadales bacterium]